MTSHPFHFCHFSALLYCFFPFWHSDFKQRREEKKSSVCQATMQKKKLKEVFWQAWKLILLNFCLSFECVGGKVLYLFKYILLKNISKLTQLTLHSSWTGKLRDHLVATTFPHWDVHLQNKIPYKLCRV